MAKTATYDHQQHKAFGGIKKGALHREMGISPKKKISVAALRKDEASAKKRGDVHRERQDQFAINAKTKFHHN